MIRIFILLTLVGISVLVRAQDTFDTASSIRELSFGSGSSSHGVDLREEFGPTRLVLAAGESFRLKETSSSTGKRAGGRTIFVGDYPGADPNGVTDSTPAFLAALRDFGNAGGVLDISGGRWLIDSADLNVPSGVSVVGNFSSWKGSTAVANGRLGTVGGLDFRTTVGSVIILNPAFTIRLGASSALRNLQIARKGLTYQLSEATNFSGTAITAVGKSYATDNYGNELIGVQIIGFARALDSNYMSRWHIERVSLDCINGIRIRNSGDVTTISHVHMWPYATNGAGVTNAQNHRSGKGLEVSNLNDIPQFDDIFIGDWEIGVDASDGAVSVPNWSGITVNGTNQLESVCFDIGTQNGGDLSGLMCYDQQIGVRIRDTSNSPLTLRGYRYINSAKSGTAISLLQGTVSLIGGSLDGMQRGIVVDNTPKAILNLEGVIFGTAYAGYITAGAAAAILGAESSYFKLNQGIGGWENQTITQLSGGSLALPINGEVFEVKASEAAGGIYNFNLSLGSSRPGRRITLVFLSATPPTVYSAAWNSGRGQIHLKGGQNFVPSAGSSLELVYSGSTEMWYELGRSE
jgi:hypothetical protein